MYKIAKQHIESTNKYIEELTKLHKQGSHYTQGYTSKDKTNKNANHSSCCNMLCDRFQFTMNVKIWISYQYY
jgi:hypothetical protein